MGFVGGCLAIIVLILVVITLILMFLGLPFFDSIYTVDCTPSGSQRKCEEFVEEFKEDTSVWRTLSGTCLIFAIIFDILVGCAMCAPIEKHTAKKAGLAGSIVALILLILCICFGIPAYTYRQIGFGWGSILLVLAILILFIQAVVCVVMVMVTKNDDDKSSRGSQLRNPRQRGRN